jgi:hypothetical protein
MYASQPQHYQQPHTAFVSQPDPYVSYGHMPAYGVPSSMAAAAPITTPATSMANALKESAVLREALAKQLV